LKKLYLLAALALAVAAVNAAAFNYYPLTVNIHGTTDEVKFAPGENAGKPDLAGKTIRVILGGTQATIFLHPTNEKTYYSDVLRIENYGGSDYYAWIKVNNAIKREAIISATLYVKDADGNVWEIDLKQRGVQPSAPDYITIPASGTLYIDVEIEIDTYADAGEVKDTVALQLIYSSQPPGS